MGWGSVRWHEQCRGRHKVIPASGGVWYSSISAQTLFGHVYKLWTARTFGPLEKSDSEVLGRITRQMSLDKTTISKLS